MANEVLSEKVSVNINSSTLSGIDLLVDNGYYSNRSDFINQALRASLQQHQSTLDRIVEKNTAGSNGRSWFFGVSGLTRKEVDAMYAAGETFSVRGYGVFMIDADCDMQKLFSVVESIRIKGKTVCPDAVKQHYGFK